MNPKTAVTTSIPIKANANIICSIILHTMCYNGKGIYIIGIIGIIGISIYFCVK